MIAFERLEKSAVKSGASGGGEDAGGATPAAATAEDLRPYVPRMLTAERAAGGPTHWHADGTLVIADVSGFTRLTERLSRQGNKGAEEMVETISTMFTALLSATADGGDVLKFSGDALVLFYDGQDHAHRGAHAALTMQRTLRRVGGVNSSAGRIRLQMSVGAHAGRFHFLLCGGDHLELFVLGESASIAVALQGVARRGEVLVDGATTAVLPDKIRATTTSQGTALLAVPPLPPVTAAQQRQDGGVERFIAPPLRARLIADEGEHEHRHATVAFASFGGIDELARIQGAQEVFDRVQALTTTTMAALDEYGVLLAATDVGRDGGTFMLTAGAPITTGDDEARMLRVIRRMTQADCGLAVRAGANAGNVFVGAVGPPFRRTYSTMGAAANVAARVMAHAEWGQVLATAAVTDRVRARFVLEPVPAFAVKGVRRPVEAGVVGPITEVVAPAAMSAPLVGRDPEVAALEDALVRARSGTGQIVEIVGEQGTGKSRLVRELQDRADATAWFVVACDPFERTSPYHAARLLLRRMMGLPVASSAEETGALLCRTVAEAAPELLPWLPLLAIPLGAAVASTPESDDLARRYRRVRIQEVTCELLEITAAHSAVIVLEDAEHMDDASAEFVAAVLSRVLPAHAWLAVVTRRDNSQGLHAGLGYAASLLNLAPLDRSASALLAAKLAERTPVPAHLLPQIVERAAGNPMFLAELVAAQSGGAEDLPRSVEDIVTARIDRLAPDDRRALRYLSVMGDRFDADLVDAVLGPLGIDSAQGERWDRLQAFIVRDQYGFTFRNALVREAAYQGLSYERRRQLHGKVADAMTRRPGRAAQLPLHLTWARRWQEAWSASLEAAETARRDAANAVAGELYALALTAARHLELPDAEVARAAQRAGEVWERAGLWHLALDAYTQATLVTSDSAELILLQLRRAQVHERAGRYPQALRLYTRALTEAEALDRDIDRKRCRARAHVGYASVRLSQGRPNAAIDHARRAVGPAQDSGDRETLAQAYHLLDRSHASIGDHDAAAGYRDLALPVFADLGDLPAQGTVLHDLGTDAQRAGRPEEALWLYEQSHEVRTRAGDVVGAAASANAIGEVLFAQDRATEARDRFADALRAWRGARYPQGVSVAMRNLGLLALRDGDPAEACRCLEEAHLVATQIGSDSLLAGIRIPLSEALLQLGRAVEAWEVATEALATGKDGIAATAHRLRGEALLRTGGVVRARKELGIAAALAREPQARATIERLLDEIDTCPPQPAAS